jgi:integrase
MKTRLTELGVAKLRPPKSGKYIWHPDTLLPSFGVRVYATGRRVWGITRRWDNAKHPAFRKIGEHPTMTLSDARARARDVLANTGALEAHQPPTDDPGSDTFGDLALAFLAHGRTKRGRILRPATKKEYRRCLLGYGATLHDRPVTDVRRADAAALLRTVATANSTTMAMHTRAAGSRFYSWLIANGYTETNPFTGTEGYTVPKRSRVLTDGEIAAIWQETEERHDFALILRMLLLTGARRAEVGAMRWSELHGGIWTVDGSRTKNHRTLKLPLPRQAVAALDQWHRFVGRDLVFGRGPNGFQAWSQSKDRLDASLGFDRPWSLHDIRRSVQTRMIGLGISRDVVSRTLNHAMTAIDETYTRYDFAREIGAALQAWADDLERIVESGAAKVVALKLP